MNKAVQTIIGLMFIAAGIVAILCVSGVIDFNFSIDGWWALFIIIPCLVSLLCGKDPIGSLVGIGVGILLMLAAIGVIEWSSIAGERVDGLKLKIKSILLSEGLIFLFRRIARPGLQSV